MECSASKWMQQSFFNWLSLFLFLSVYGLVIWLARNINFFSISYSGFYYLGDPKRNQPKTQRSHTFTHFVCIRCFFLLFFFVSIKPYTVRNSLSWMRNDQRTKICLKKRRKYEVVFIWLVACANEWYYHFDGMLLLLVNN